MSNQVCEIFPAFRDYLQPARFKVAYGGRGSAKTRTFCTILLNNVMQGWRLVCFREIMKSVDDSVYQEFVDEIGRRGLDKYFDVLRAEIRCPSVGGVIKFDGLHRNQQKIKGYAGFDAAWVEEAAAVTEESWKFLIPTLRKDGSELWVSFNPESELDNTYTRFVTRRVYPDMKDGKRYCVVKKINYDANPRFPDELRVDMEIMKDEDYDLYLHVYEGQPVANSALAIIPPSWARAAVDIHKFLNMDDSGAKATGFDVSDEGTDPNAQAYLSGIVITGLKEWKDQDPNSAAVQTWDDSLEYGSNLIVFDSIGVGAGAKGELRQCKERHIHGAMIAPTVIGFDAGGAVRNPDMMYREAKSNKDMFMNAKAQEWWRLRDACHNAWKARQGKDFDMDNLVSFDSELIPADTLDKCLAEMSAPMREYVGGKVKVESKDKLKKRGVPSHNLADAVIMARYQGNAINAATSMMTRRRRR